MFYASYVDRTMTFWLYFVGDVEPAMQSVAKLASKELDVINNEEEVKSRERK